ncbi:MAG: dihydroorotase [Prevotellaceae bacterium]|nr:dihydroorotase [Prevotellaceae bacterium]MDY2634062.1 dihydroorotase [Prevotella sp.]
MKTLISDAIIVNEGRAVRGSVLIDNEYITDIFEGVTLPDIAHDRLIDAGGNYLLPGLIDTHVHFREPGITTKATIESESKAAAFGGVTSFFDMPNTSPQTTNPDAWQQKCDIARASSHINYAFFFGATNNNIDLLSSLDKHAIPGVKLFMGASTGNMLVDRLPLLRRIFSTVKLPLVTHCEDSDEINRNMQQAKKYLGEDPSIVMHPLIRSEQACLRSTRLATELATEYGTRLHIAHISTAAELELLAHTPSNITAEAVIAHLYFTHHDYNRLQALIKCNPSIKGEEDREALRKGLTNGSIHTIGTDHAPHLWSEKQGGCSKAASGMPMIQFSLVTLLELVDAHHLTIEQLVQLACHNPASLFAVDRRGFIRKGYKADLTIVSPDKPWEVTTDIIKSKCGWSPMTGHTYRWKVEHTWCNGHHILNNGIFDEESRGEALRFRN